MTIIGYTPAGFPITSATPPCRYAGCSEPGVHGGLCGPHWWKWAESRSPEGRWGRYAADAPAIARCAAAVVVDGEQVTATDIADRIREQWPGRWPNRDDLRVACRLILRRASAAGAAVADHCLNRYTIRSVGRLARCCDD